MSRRRFDNVKITFAITYTRTDSVSIGLRFSDVRTLNMYADNYSMVATPQRMAYV